MVRQLEDLKTDSAITSEEIEKLKTENSAFEGQTESTAELEQYKQSLIDWAAWAGSKFLGGVKKFGG